MLSFSVIVAVLLLCVPAPLIKAEEPVLHSVRFNLDLIRSSPSARLIRDFQATGSPTSEQRRGPPSSEVVYDASPSPSASVVGNAAEPVSTGSYKFAPLSAFVTTVKGMPGKLQHLGKAGRARVQRQLSVAVHAVVSGPVARRVRAALDPLVVLLFRVRDVVSWARLGVMPLRLRQLRNTMMALLVRFATQAEQTARRLADQMASQAARPIFVRRWNKPKPTVPAAHNTTSNMTEPTVAFSPARVSQETPQSSPVLEAVGDARADGMGARSVSGSGVEPDVLNSHGLVAASSTVLVASAGTAVPSGMATLPSASGQGLVSEEAAMEGVSAEAASSSHSNQSSQMLLNRSSVPAAEQEADALVVLGAGATGPSAAEDSVSSPSEFADVGVAEAGDVGGEQSTVVTDDQAGVPAYSEELDSEDGEMAHGEGPSSSRFSSHQLLLLPRSQSTALIDSPSACLSPCAISSSSALVPWSSPSALSSLSTFQGGAVTYEVDGTSAVSASALALPASTIGHPSLSLSDTPILVLREPLVSAGPGVNMASPLPSSSAPGDLLLLLPSTADLSSSPQPSQPQGAELALVPRGAVPVGVLPLPALPVVIIEAAPPASLPDLMSPVSQLADSTARVGDDGLQRAALPAARILNASTSRADGRDVMSAAAVQPMIFANLSPSPAYVHHHDRGTPAAPTWRDAKTSVRPVVSEDDVPPPPRQLHEADDAEDDVAVVSDSEPGRVGEDQPHPPAWSVPSLGWLVDCFTDPGTWSLERGVEYLRASGAALGEAAWDRARSFVVNCGAAARSRAVDMLQLVGERAKVFGLQVLDSVAATAPAAKEAVGARLGQGADYLRRGALRLWGFSIGFWRNQLLGCGRRLGEYVLAHERTGRVVVFLGGHGEALMHHLYSCKIQAEERVQASMQPLYEAASRTWTTTTAAVETQVEQAHLLLHGCWRRACGAAEDLGINAYIEAGAAAFDAASSVVTEHCGRARAWSEPVVLSAVEVVSEQAGVLGRAASARCLQVLDSVWAVAPVVKEAVVTRLGQGAGYVASGTVKTWGFTGGYCRGKLLVFGPRVAEYVVTHEYTVRGMAYVRVCGAAAARIGEQYKARAEQRVEAINGAIWEAASRTWRAAAGGAERALEQLQQQAEDVWRRACGWATEWTARATAEVKAVGTMMARTAVDGSARAWLWINEACRGAVGRARASLVDATQAVTQLLRTSATELSESWAARLVTWRSSVADRWRAGWASVGAQAEHAYLSATELGSAMVRDAKAGKAYQALLALQGHGDVGLLLGRARSALKGFIAPLLSTARADLMQSWTLPAVVDALAEHPYGVAAAMAALLLLVLSFFAALVRARVTTRSSNSQQVRA